ncbi:hypothetical protein EDD94_2368 [Streptomyces sp. PanSC9]|nr:hypothetical protein EDD94_2368 [Streptomyces sp. PanSC9]
MENGEGNSVDLSKKQRGIFDCADAYRTPTSADYKRLFANGMVVLDANVLLNLYRSNERTRRDTFAVLRQLQNQLWVPHQVLSEFWRNRDLPSVKGHHRAKARTACSALDKTFKSMSDATDRWLKDVHLDADDAARQRIGAYREHIQRSLDGMKTFIEKQAENDALDGTESTHTDPVLLQLEPLLLGKIGDPFSPEDYAEAVKEAKRRADKAIPPGYADYATKPDEQAAGDYLVWKQVLNAAAINGRSVLLVTGDIKEDWWAPRTDRNPARPRPELRNELRSKANVDLFMLTPSQLLAEASTAFKLKVDERSVNDLARRESVVDLFPAAIRNAIVSSVESAHERAMVVHEVSGLKTRSPYGSTISAAVAEELNERMAAIGGTAIRVGGASYPVVDGLLFMPLRIPAVKNASAISGWNKLRDVQELLEPSEMLDFGQAPSKDLTPVVITYTASPSSGIESIVAGTGRFTGDGQFTFQVKARLL